MKKVILSMVMMVILGLNAYAQQVPTLTKVINSEVIDTVVLNGSNAIVYDLEGYQYDVLLVRSVRGITLYKVNDSDVLLLKQYGSGYAEKLERL